MQENHHRKQRAKNWTENLNGKAPNKLDSTQWSHQFCCEGYLPYDWGSRVTNLLGLSRKHRRLHKHIKNDWVKRDMHLVYEG